MTDRRLFALSWLLVGLLAWPWLDALRDRIACSTRNRNDSDEIPHHRC